MNEEEIAALLEWLRAPHEPVETVPGRSRWLILCLLKNFDERLQVLEGVRVPVLKGERA